MLYPIRNKFRQITDLSGFWKFKIDKESKGEEEKYFNGFSSDIDIALPGSWNEQLEELGLLHYTGSAWYSTDVYIPEEYKNKRIWLRIGSADYYSKLWINGKLVGENNCGFLPFEFEISQFVEPSQKASIVILVNNELNESTIPQGISSEDYFRENRMREETFPPARFDFSPFGGIHRPVILYTTPKNYINKIKIDFKVINNMKAIAKIHVETQNIKQGSIRTAFKCKDFIISSEAELKQNASNFIFEIDNCNLWSPDNPFLYDFHVQAVDKNEITDEYEMPIGIREVKISNNKLLLNGKEIFIRGFGKHEDFWAIGKGLFLPLIVKDFQILKWIGANSFRTSHYPYAEEILYYADKHGILIIDEVPAVSIDTRYVNETTINNHKSMLGRLVERDYNHPCVIMWAVGNEPNLVGADEYYDGSGRNYWKQIFEYARTLDKTRPFTVPNCQRAGVDDPVFEFSDVLTINRYYGWYENPGQINKAIELMSNEMDTIYKKYNKPVFVTEFGADTISGFHSTSDQLFTEEYQAKLLEEYIKLIESKDYTIGEHVWNFADFRTPQHFRRVVMNMKGVFTRNREPKLAAFKIKELWK